MVKSLKFKYKGGRDYVHGTDVFIQMIDGIKKKYDINDNKVDIDMSIYKVTKNCVDIYEVSNSKIDLKPNIVFNITDNNNVKETFFLVENDEPVTERYEYPEDKIISSANFDAGTKTISTLGLGDFDFIENVVALNKGLLGYLYNDSTLRGKWYFTKVRLRNFDFSDTINFSTLEISLKKNLDFKLTDSEIKLNGNTIGNIYFSLV